MITIIFGRFTLSHTFESWIQAYIHPVTKITDVARRKKVFLFSTSIYSISCKYLHLMSQLFHFTSIHSSILQKHFNRIFFESCHILFKIFMVFISIRERERYILKIINILIFHREIFIKVKKIKKMLIA